MGDNIIMHSFVEPGILKLILLFLLDQLGGPSGIIKNDQKMVRCSQISQLLAVALWD
jgi:hypothetical protein